MSNPVQPVIIVRKKAGHHPHHGGAWKVAYADFVTAMMAFFMVMWLVGSSPQIKAGVGGYFRDPIGGLDGGRGVLPGADSIDVPKPQGPIDSANEERARLEAVVESIREVMDANPSFQGLKDQVEFTVTPEGLRIDLIEKSESSFFDSGSASLRGESERLLAAIAKELGPIKHDLDIEGHTDSAQYMVSDKYSNWELSADRANAARRVIERNGVEPKQIAGVRGLADRELRIPENPLDPRNRRVSIMVKSPVMTKGGTLPGDRPAPPSPAEHAAPNAPADDAAHVASEVAKAIAH
jgi:chemotaxis protein MotB